MVGSCGSRILFLTSKVRLHCDMFARHSGVMNKCLFLTSRVRLHCDEHFDPHAWATAVRLFLTSKVRLHCDWTRCGSGSKPTTAPFPDLKGQAPLRLRPVLPRSVVALAFS